MADEMLPIDDVRQKQCPKCRQTLPFEQFGISNQTSLGIYSRCRKCRSEDMTAWRSQNYVKDWDTRLRRNFGITLEQYQALLAEQGGVCAICGEPPTDENSGRWRQRRRNPVPAALVVDHDHVTGNVRGLLCGRCNTGIGFLKDDPVIVRFALKYLEERSE